MLRLFTRRAIAASKYCRRQYTAPPPPPMMLELLASLAEDGMRSVGAFDTRLGPVEQKLDHILGYQVKLEVPRDRQYLEQTTVDSLINLVAQIPKFLLLYDPSGGSDVHSKVLFTATEIAHNLIWKDVPKKFLNELVQHLGVEHSTVFLPNGVIEFSPIRQHSLAEGNCTALMQLENFFQLQKKPKKKQATFLATCKGPGLLFLIFTVCPRAIFKQNKLCLYSDLEFDFQGPIKLLVNKVEASRTIDLGEGKSTKDMSMQDTSDIPYFALRLDLLELLLERFMQVREFSREFSRGCRW